ncbi:Sac2 family-domain-containing protein [Paraphysoderma sedebokerense]|nr:Sac2 family-domain-containing protein [Paraphysoderma sedebokerense]
MAFIVNLSNHSATNGPIIDHITEFQEDQRVKEAFAKGVDLRDYAKTLDEELETVEQALVLDYVKQSKTLANLYLDIQTCDETLERMEQLLSTFQKDLSDVSTEIQSLQDQSTTLNVKLKNRTNLQSSLGNVLDGIVVGPDLIKKISETEVNELYLQFLGELNSKMLYMKSNKDKHIKAFRDVGPELERLRNKAAEKSRDFLLDKFKSLRIPNTNIQIIQSSILLKYKFLNHFIMRWHSEVANEVKLNYVAIVNRYFAGLFEKYMKGMHKLQTVIADKYDLIGLEENAKKGTLSNLSSNITNVGAALFTSSSGKSSALRDKSNVFSLGDRINVLNDSDSTGVIITHVAEEKNLRYSFEYLFKSLNRMLIDSVTAEYNFDIEFFKNERKSLGSPAAVALNLFNEVFDPTLKLCLQTTKDYASVSYDAVCILLCIRLQSMYNNLMQHRGINVLSSYFDSLHTILWPRFQAIMDLHVDSVKKANVAKLVSGKERGAHYITRRYAEFAVSILSLNEGYEETNLINTLSRLRVEVQSLLWRMASEFGNGAGGGRKAQLIFLINNYDLVVGVLSESPSKYIEVEREDWDKLLNERIGDYVEEELSPYFGNLMTLIQIHHFNSNNQFFVSPEKLDRVASEFNQTYRNHITTINSSVTQNFTNFENGTIILQSVLSELVVYYSRFMEIVETKFRKQGGPGGMKVQPVGVQNVMVEVKKYKGSF